MLHDTLLIAIEAVATAMSITRAVQHRVEAVAGHLKDDRSPVTVADYAAQAIVSMTLREGIDDPALQTHRGRRRRCRSRPARAGGGTRRGDGGGTVLAARCLAGRRAAGHRCLQSRRHGRLLVDTGSGRRHKGLSSAAVNTPSRWACCATVWLMPAFWAARILPIDPAKDPATADRSGCGPAVRGGTWTRVVGVSRRRPVRNADADHLPRMVVTQGDQVLRLRGIAPLEQGADQRTAGTVQERESDGPPGQSGQVRGARTGSGPTPIFGSRHTTTTASASGTMPVACLLPKKPAPS